MNGRLTVGGQVQVREEIVRQGLANVCSVELERHEHDARPHHDLEVDLAHQPVLLTPGPSRRRVEAMRILPIHTKPLSDMIPTPTALEYKAVPIGGRLVFLYCVWVVENTRLDGESAPLVFHTPRAPTTWRRGLAWVATASAS